MPIHNPRVFRNLNPQEFHKWDNSLNCMVSKVFQETQRSSRTLPRCVQYFKSSSVDWGTHLGRVPEHLWVSLESLWVSLELFWDHDIGWFSVFLELLWDCVEPIWEGFWNTIRLWIGMANFTNIHFSLDLIKVCQWNRLHCDHHPWHFTVQKVFPIVYSPFN